MKNLTIFKFEPTTPNTSHLARALILHQGMRTSSICKTQYGGTRRNRVAKHTQYVVPTMLRYVAFECCDRLPRASYSFVSS